MSTTLRTFVFFVLLLQASCGKVGDPLPPFIRIPEAVTDLKVQQVGYRLVLTWTNPPRNIDGSAATDLLRAHIFSNGRRVDVIEAAGGGRDVSHTLPIGGPVGAPRTFAIQLETRAGKMSEVSNSVSITPVDVPGPVVNLRATVDQRRITLGWDPPVRNPRLADTYRVRRTDREDVTPLTERRFEDANYQELQRYTYEVSVARRVGEENIDGEDSPKTIVVNAIDTTEPRTPTGIEAISAGNGGFITWTENTERDLAGYRIYRSDRPDGGFVPLVENLHTTNAFFDPAYRTGLYYAVSAVDESGNEGERSVPFRVQ
ncbi:MAG: fibronectin type III domain-containing protein [Acidobacteria bacterium]|nr:fibronectin type III domain-containing protein [Acidobacteriota bacterium]